MTFKDLNISTNIKKALEEAGITTPTPIQEETVPLLLNSSKIDFHGQAQTGTGKTLAFGIPLLEKIDTASKKTQALILAPTRELALQITESLVSAAKYLNISIVTIYGGVPIQAQMSKLRSGAQIVVGTPGRVNDHIRQKTFFLDSVYTLILDEADVMLDMGFREEIDDILNKLNKERQIWLFSATIKSGISALMKSHMVDTKVVRVSKEQIGNSNTKQYYCLVPFKSRLQAIVRFVESIVDFYGFIFCQTKILTSDIAEQLIKHGYDVGALHGDMSQAQRNLTIKRFKNKDLKILVATDVAARGIDVANLTHVINFSVPEDQESYVHRVGRTGRAGKMGISITFASRSDLKEIAQIEKRFNVKVDPIEIPSLKSLTDIRTNLAKEFIQEILNSSNNKINPAMSSIVQDLTQEQAILVASKLLNDKFISTLDTQEINTTAASSDDFKSSDRGGRREGSRGGSRGGRSGRGGGFGRDRDSRGSRDGGRGRRFEKSADSSFGDERPNFERKSRLSGERSSGFERKPRFEGERSSGFERKPRTQEEGSFGRSSDFERKPRFEGERSSGFERKPRTQGEGSFGRSSGFERKPRFEGERSSGFERKPRTQGEGSFDRSSRFERKPRFEGERSSGFERKPRFESERSGSSFGRKPRSDRKFNR